jgi:hypothetical protein
VEAQVEPGAAGEEVMVTIDIWKKSRLTDNALWQALSAFETAF